MFELLLVWNEISVLLPGGHSSKASWHVNPDLDPKKGAALTVLVVAA
jgi:hypothetical protein